MFLQRQFYREVVKIFDSLDRQDTERASNIFLEAGGLLFEAQSIPKLDALDGLKTLKATTWFDDIRPFTSEKNSRILYAESLISGKATLSKNLLSSLIEFKRRIVNSESGFYSSAEFFGGDFYDVANHHKINSGNRNFYDPEYAYHLEHLRLRSLYSTDEVPDELIRLFTAYYNARELKINFQALYDSAVGENILKMPNGMPIPFIGSIVEEYWRSYAGPCFQVFLDELSQGRIEPILKLKSN